MLNQIKYYSGFFALFTILLMQGCAGPSEENIPPREPGVYLEISNYDTGQSSTTFSENDIAKVEVLLIGADQYPLANEIVNLAVNIGGAYFASESVLTDKNGKAEVKLFSSDVVTGSDTGTISASGGGYVSEPLSYQFYADSSGSTDPTPRGIQLKMTVASTGEETNSVTINDSANVEITLYDYEGNLLKNTALNVTATAGIIAQDALITDSNGQARISIEPPEDLEFGSAPGLLTVTTSALSQSATLNYEFMATVASDGNNATAIQFEEVSHPIISLKGTGNQGFGEASRVNFRVYNGLTTVSGAEVNFMLSSSVGGVRFGNGDTRTSAITDNLGQVSVVVNSGNVATPVRVTAYIELDNGDTVFVQSSVITITTGIPDQNSFSLSLSKFAPEGANYDGDTVEVNARLADRYNNPVPDGTVVNFTTEGGRIDASCVTENSACTVIWESQNPRPHDHRSTIMAYAIGHETYYDENGTGVFDGNLGSGDEFDDLPEAFRDDDENGVYDPDANDGFDYHFSRDEIFIDYDGTRSYSQGDGKFNGVPCYHAFDCPGNSTNLAGRLTTLTNIRTSALVIMANSSAKITFRQINSGSSCLTAGGKLIDEGSCTNIDGGLIFPGGENVIGIWVLIEEGRALCRSSDGGVRVDTVNADDPLCAHAVRQSAATGSGISVSSDIGSPTSAPYSAIPNTYAPTEFIINLTSSGDNDEIEVGTFEVKVTSPVTGTVSSRSISVIDPADAAPAP